MKSCKVADGSGCVDVSLWTPWCESVQVTGCVVEYICIDWYSVVRIIIMYESAQASLTD